MLISPRSLSTLPVRFEDLPISFADVRVTEDGDAIAPRVLLLANDMLSGLGVMPLLARFTGALAQAATAKAAIELARTGDYDAIVVDFRPDLLGYEAVCQLRVAQVDLPVLFISARSNQDAFDRAYAIGADDVMVLPASHEVLETRLASLTRRIAQPERTRLQVGRLQIDLLEREGWFDGKRLFLSGSEYAVLELMVTRNGAPVAKAAIAERLAEEADGRSLDSFMTRLRRKLSNAGAGEMIRTVWGQGYAISALPMAARSARPTRPMVIARAA